MSASFFLAKKEYKIWRQNQIIIDTYGEETVPSECKLMRDIYQRNSIKHFNKTIEQ
jgi:uncharacterized protein (DUF779 family)